MSSKDGNKPTSGKIGYTRKEFGIIFQIYSQYVYEGLFRDFSFSEINGKYFISYREEAGQTPLVTIEKRRLGPDRYLFVATSAGAKNALVEIARSEKIDAFARQLRQKISAYSLKRELSGDNVRSIVE